ncbi:alpha/beta hydrolase family esterase [Pseudoduganella sp. UC29_106]|uniref:alpha/beta hydrolase family esterase n=1 Tax=Pseudoduganella sp. UC29_106 TaxID=3374553 RepID=UPI00375839E7
MKAIATFAAFAALLPCAPQAATITSGELTRPEGPRHYLLATPQQPAAGKRPLVIVLHGHAGSASLVFGKERLNAPMQQWLNIADREQLLVIAPDGARGSDDKRGWNDCRADAETNPKTDDVGFISALIDKAIAEHGADPARVYAIGTSNGGGMVYRLGVELAPRLAGIAAIAALWPARSLCTEPAQALPVMAVHGTADKITPFDGGEVGHFLLRGRGSAISVERTLAIWRKVDQLPDAAQEGALPRRRESGDTSARRYVWGADPQGMQVEFIKVEKGGHTEPSIGHRMQWYVNALLGAQNADFETAEEAWAFFRNKKREPRP